jgi:hypothetical protein
MKDALPIRNDLTFECTTLFVAVDAAFTEALTSLPLCSLPREARAPLKKINYFLEKVMCLTKLSMRPLPLRVSARN